MSDDSREVASPAPRRSLAQDSLSSDDNGTHQLAVAVDDLLDQLQSKFDKVSSEIFEKMDDMSRRLDALEASLSSSTGGEETN